MSRDRLPTAQNAGTPLGFSGRRVLVPGAVLLLIGLNLRPAIVAIAPLLDDVRRDTGMSYGVSGVLSTAPVVCFGIFAPLAPRLASRFGFERT